MLLLPAPVQEWVPEGDIAHFISDVVDALDLSEIEAVYDEEMRGYPPCHPRMMTRLWLYAYAVGTRSCRKLAKLAPRAVGCMMLAAGNRPDFRTLNSFRLRHLAALGGLFQQVLLLCRDEGLVKLDHVAVDGTKLKANASKHAAMSYDWMQPEVDRITAELDTWFRECDQTDAEEDAPYGADHDGDELPENLRTAAKRRAAIRTAIKDLKERAQTEGKTEPDAKAQQNFTDSESRIMKGIEANLDELPSELSADAGYCSEANLEALDELGVTAYVATGRMPRSYRCPAAPRGRIPAGLTRRERMKRRLMTKRGRERYRLRQQVGGPVFGQIKNKGLIRIWLHGEQKAEHEWLLHCTGHNLSKLHGAWA
jgi:transposase